MYEYKPLSFVSHRVICDCFNLAFSDYSLPIQINEEDLERLFITSNVDKELSFAAFFNGEMVGFIINSSNIYNDSKVIFDVATAIVPEHRGKKLFSTLFDYVEHQLKSHHIEGYYLEVLQSNETAIQIYTKKGFKIEREYIILKGPNSINDFDSSKIHTISLNEFNISGVLNCTIPLPSYENSTNILSLNPKMYKVIYTENSGIITAFCIYSISHGSIVQLGYYDKDDLRILIKKMIATYPNLMVKNIDLQYSQVIDIFIELGFTEMTKQFEMVKQYFLL